MNSTGDMVPATMVPYLAAPVHFTLSNEDNGVYHAHGTYLIDGMSMAQVAEMMKTMTMDQMMEMQDSDPAMYNLSMNALMIGVEMNGTLNCKSDEGAIMTEMMGMMNMSIYYGPSTFNVISGLFDFPDTGHWRMFAYMAMEMEDGSQRLFVPQIDFWANNPQTQSNSMSSGSVLSVSIALLLSLIFLVL